MTLTAHRIEKSIALTAAPARVWQALADSAEFGAWFGLAIDAPFVPGTRVGCRLIMPSRPEFDGFPFDIWIEVVEPMERLAFRWHPAAIDRNVDYSAEPTTLVEFTITGTSDGVLLQVTESGFDQLPPLRHTTAFEMNTGGWEFQLQNIARHVGGIEA